MNKYIVLMDNLLMRLEYNERQDVHILKGSVTPDEREALRRASDAFKEKEAYAKNDYESRKGA